MRQFLKTWYWILIPLLLALAVHAPSLSCGFVWDDVSLVEQHPSLSEPGFAKTVFSRDYGLEFGSRQPVGYYRPFLMVLNVALHASFGNSALAYHLFSLVIFCMATLAVAWLVREIAPRNKKVLAFLVACLYAAHPARTEVVSLFMSLPDLLVELFTACTIILLVRPFRNRAIAFAFAALFCTTAALSKEVAMLVLPAVALTALIHAIVNKRDWQNPASVLAGVAIGCSLAITMTISAGIEHHPASAYLRAVFTNGSGRALTSFFTAIQHILIPGPAVFMTRSQLSANAITQAALPILLLVGLALFIILINKKSMAPAILLAWFGSRMLSLFTLRAVHVPYSQRYLPVASAIIGLCLIVCHLVRKIDFSSSRERRTRSALLVSLYIALHAAFTLGSSIKCASPIAFFTFMAEEHRTLAYPRIHLAPILGTCSESIDKAEAYAREAMKLEPDKPQVRDLGKLCALIRLRKGDHEGAIDDLKWASEVIKTDPQIEHLLALSYYRLDQYNAALPHITRAIELNPDNQVFVSLRDDIMTELE